MLLVCKKCHYAIHKGHYLVLRNIKGQDFIKNDKSNEVLESLKYAKINRIYFQEDKTSLVNGKYFCCVRSNGDEEELDDEKWYFINKTKWKDLG